MRKQTGQVAEDQSLPPVTVWPKTVTLPCIANLSLPLSVVLTSLQWVTARLRSQSLGHVETIDRNRRNSFVILMGPHEARRYNEEAQIYYVF